MELSLASWTLLDDHMLGLAKKFLYETGMLCFAEESGRLQGLVDLFERRELPYLELSASEVRSQFPRHYGQVDLPAVYLEDAGVLHATKAVTATWDLGERLGVETLEGHAVGSITPQPGGGFVVETNGVSEESRRIECGSLILAPGAWLSTMTRKFFQIEIPTRLTSELVSYHRADAEFAVKKEMPVFTARAPNGLGPHGYYGIPQMDIAGVKVSAHHCGDVLTKPEDEPTDGRAIIEANKNIVRRLWPNGDVEADAVIDSHRCLYTATPDHDYVLGLVAPDCSVVGGGSGHAFKNAPALGDAAASIALGATPPFDVTPFAIDRPALVEARGLNIVPTPARCK